MKKIVSLLLCLCLILPTFAMGEDDEDIEIVDLLEEEEVTLDDEGNEVLIDDETGEKIIIGSVDEEMLEDLDLEIDTTVKLDDLELNHNLPEDTINILLIGVDTRYKDLGAGVERGDVQIIASIDPTSGTIKLSSIMRDLYVPIAGKKGSKRINEAYSEGTEECSGGMYAMRTINRNFEMNIQHYVTINFYGVVAIVESLGGIDVDLTKAEAKAINAYLKKNKKQISKTYDDKKGDRTPLEAKAGIQHLDGLQALMYARLRHSDSNDNDFNRTSRQRHLLELLLKKVLTDDNTDYWGLITTCLDYVKTDMSFMDIMELASSILQSDLIDRAKGGEVLLEDFRIPMDGTWKYATENGRSVVEFRTNDRKQENIEGLHEFIYGQYYPANLSE